MADLQGAKYEQGRDTKPVILSEDVTEGNVLAISDASTSPMTIAIAGAGDVPVGWAPQTVDISEDGTRYNMVFRGLVPVLLAAAGTVTDATLPVMTAAAGAVTPVTANNDVMLGYPQHTAGNARICLVDLQQMGSFYGV